MRITNQDLEELRRRKAAGPTIAQITTSVKRPELRRLSVWIEGKLKNPNNGAQGSWEAKKGERKAWRRRTLKRVDEAIWVSGWCQPAAVRKRITFLARTHNPVDDDNLRAMLKPVRDGLQDAGLIDGDATRHGHVFKYRQCVDRKVRGVTVEIELLTDDHNEETDGDSVGCGG